MEKKELIGRKVKGFAFESGTSGAIYLEGMDKFVGRLGVIFNFNEEKVAVYFGDESAYYPASLIEQHLVTENQTDMELLDKFAMAALPSVINRMSIYDSSEDVSNACYDIAKAMLDERKKYEKDLNLGV